MATVTGLTAARMVQIEAQSVVDGDVVGGNLILTKHDGSTINAGSVVGPVGPQGPQGLSPIPGEMKLWPGAALPNPAKYGKWAWANGDIFDVATYPEAAANIAPAWKTAMGQADPGAGKFRVPDMRGLVPAGPDAMPIGAARANRVTRAAALPIASNTGEEKHVIITAEMPSHTHTFAGSALPAHGHSGSTFTGNALAAHAHASFNTSPGMKYATNRSANGGANGVSDIANITGSTDPNIGNPSTNAVSAGVPSGSVAVATASAGTPAGTNAATGGGTSHENMQPTVFVPYIVKLDD